MRFVATIRADLFDRPLQHPTIGPLVGAGTFVLAPMSPAELADAIALPAATAGVHFDEAVVAPRRRCAGQPEHCRCCSSCWPSCTTAASMGASAPMRSPRSAAWQGRSGAEPRRSTRRSTAMPRRVRALFGRLVVPGDRAPDTRRRARLSELPAGAGT